MAVDRREVYIDLFNYWLKIFAVAFGMGVVSGIVMAYQFGTNWGGFADRAGPIVGPLMGYEVLTAFFLEAGFLGVMLFGMTGRPQTCISSPRDGRHRHSDYRAFWILAANSWMQRRPDTRSRRRTVRSRPTGSSIIFNPSFPYRLVHMVLAAYLTTAFIVGARRRMALAARFRLAGRA